jgi:histidinol dehydrogenase
MRWVRSGTAGFKEALSRASLRGATEGAKVSAVVSEIIARIREGGDAALAEYTRRFDRFDPARKGFAVPRKEIDAAWGRVPRALAKSLELAAERIADFHRRQIEKGYGISMPGATIGQRVHPVARAGIYVPGGKAAYPSTLLMNAVPARVAGVPEVAAACAAPGGKVPDVVLAAARIAGVSAVYRVGGAQAIAALAFGTRSIPAVDVIAGPANAYVTEAKRQVFGIVGIDCSRAQRACGACRRATRKPLSSRRTCCPRRSTTRTLRRAGDRLGVAPRKVGARDLPAVAAALPQGDLAASLPGATVLRPDLREGVDVVNRLAPEHLIVATRDRGRRSRGSATPGPLSGAAQPVAVGDYIAGINHTLPTGGAARFASPLGVAISSRKPTWYHMKFPPFSPTAPTWSAGRKEGLDATRRRCGLRMEERGKRR